MPQYPVDMRLWCMMKYETMILWFEIHKVYGTMILQWYSMYSSRPYHPSKQTDQRMPKSGADYPDYTSDIIMDASSLFQWRPAMVQTRSSRGSWHVLPGLLLVLSCASARIEALAIIEHMASPAAHRCPSRCLWKTWMWMPLKRATQQF